eukprot:1529523-Pyramimonas_sp.AAC.1
MSQTRGFHSPRYRYNRYKVSTRAHLVWDVILHGGEHDHRQGGGILQRVGEGEAIPGGAELVEALHQAGHVGPGEPHGDVPGSRPAHPPRHLERVQHGGAPHAAQRALRVREGLREGRQDIRQEEIRKQDFLFVHRGVTWRM